VGTGVVVAGNGYGTVAVGVKAAIAVMVRATAVWVCATTKRVAVIVWA